MFTSELLFLFNINKILLVEIDIPLHKYKLTLYLTNVLLFIYFSFMPLMIIGFRNILMM